MCTWRCYDGGESNNCELEIWQLVDSDGEIIEEYDIEELREEAADWFLYEGKDENQYITWKSKDLNEYLSDD